MIRFLVCGKVKEDWLRAGIGEYVKRISGYEKTEVVEVADERTPASASAAEVRKILDLEAERLLARIKPSDYVILLDLAGKQMDSVRFAVFLDEIHTSGYGTIDFVIGGSLGVGEALIRRSDRRWCLSEATFPHQLCRLFVAEQVYRAFRILKNEPYHK